MRDDESNTIPLTIELVSEKISTGDLISYKDLCILLGQKTYSGCQKESQLKEWKRYFNFEKENRKLLITEIYDIPLDPECRKLRDDAIYVKYVECILLQYLANKPGYNVQIPPRELWKVLGIINNEYFEYEHLYEDLYLLEPGMNSLQIDNFYYRCNSNIPKIVESALKSLERRYLIKYDPKAYMIGKRQSNGYIKYELADNKEKSYILDCERKALVEMGYYSKSQVHLKRKDTEFYNKARIYLFKNYKYDGYYKVYDITYVQKNIIEAIPEDKITLQKMILNSEVINRMNTHAEKTYEKFKIEYNEALHKLMFEDEELTQKENNILSYDYGDGYLLYQKVLADKLLKLEEKVNKKDEINESNEI